MDSDVIATVQQTCASGKSDDTAVGMFTPDLSELPDWQDRGASLFLLSSEHSLALVGANKLAQAIR